MERSRRATNPNNYNPNGTVKKGCKKWNNSKTYLKICSAKANLERKLAAQRKSLHGELVNTILRTGDTIKLEKLSYKAFQKLFGKSVGKRAPGMFVSHLKSKAERAGGQVVEIPTHSTKLSQTCQCGRVAKKKLSERVHRCECGVVAQRDLYSAFLAKHIEPDTFVLQVSQLLVDWQSAELRLQAAWRTATECNQLATGRVFPSSFGRCPEALASRCKSLCKNI
jgi:putative transposase